MRTVLTNNQKLKSLALFDID